ncbi:MAG: HXXEE domain-containing protein [Promethearchaeota archaeon]
MNLKSFNKIWPRIGGVFATIITIIVMVLWNKYYPGSVIFLLFWLNLAVLMYHEFEEYVLPGGFRHFINYKTVLGVSEPGDKEPISDMVIIVINLGIWVIFIIAALLAKIAPIIFQKKVKGYNPGMITAILMIPYLIFALKIVIDQNILSTGEYILAAIVGIVSGISLPISGVIIRKRTLK